MGCVSSKQTVPVTPAVDHSGGFRDNAAVGSYRSIDGNGGDAVVQLENKMSRKKKKNNTRSESGLSVTELSESGRINLNRYVEVEQVAAGWPAWLSAVAGEAIRGWVPLKAESFEKLEKVFLHTQHLHCEFLIYLFN